MITDDLAIPTGSIRLRAKGGAGGHNGLTSINEILGTDEYARLRVGIGSNYPRGGQVNYVLGEWTTDEMGIINTRLPLTIEMIKSFVTAGCELTMTAFNKEGKNMDDDSREKREGR